MSFKIKASSVVYKNTASRAAIDYFCSEEAFRYVDASDLSRMGLETNSYSIYDSLESTKSKMGEPLILAGRWTWRLTLACFATFFGSAIPVGFNIGVVNTPAAIIKQWCNESLISRYGWEADTSSLDTVWSAIVSIFLIGAMIGSFAGAVVADKIGRKGTMIVAGILPFVAALMYISSKYVNSIEVIFIGRLLSGLSAGLVTSVMPMYLTELAPVNLRGVAGMFCPIGINFGVALAQFLGLPFVLGNEEYWNWLLGFYFVLIIVAAVAIPWLCESPKYLFSVCGLKQQAIQQLCLLRQLPSEIVVAELDEKSNVDQSKDTAWNICKVLKHRSLRLNLALVCALHAGQQLSGINAVFYYSVSIFKSAGLSEAGAQYASLSASVINLVFAALIMPVINNSRRRVMTITSCSLSAFFLVLLSFTITYMHTFAWLSYISIVAVLGYVMSYCLALGPIPFFIGSELFDVGPRPAAMALGCVFNWSSNFIIGMTFLELMKIMGQYSFLLFAAFTAALTIFVRLCLPETNPKFMIKETDASLIS